MNQENLIEEYKGFVKRRYLLIIGLAVALIGLALITLNLGSTELSFDQILYYLFHPDDSWNTTVVWDLRLKMIVAAILAGSALALAGCVMQSILRNPLASPFTLGLSNAAAFGAAMGILFLNGGSIVGSTVTNIVVSNPAIVTICAFGFAMLATLIMILLVKVTGCRPETIVLAGLAISSIFSAGLAFMQYVADDTVISAIVFWQFGSLSKASWDNLILIGIVLILALIYFIYTRWDLNIMESGEEVAGGLGVNVKLTRYLGLTVCAILTAVVVSFMGVIGFIGLVGPHMIKRLVGNDSRYVIPGSMLIGSLVLLLAYIVGSFTYSTVIPVGIITSAIGGPIFIAILLKGRGTSY